MRILQQAFFVILLVIFIASIPWVTKINPMEKSIYWDFGQLGQTYIDFVKELSNGNLGTYTVGSQIRYISDDLTDHFITSLVLLLVGLLLAVLFSIIFGIFLNRFKLTRFVNFFLNVFATIPDFILIMFSLILAIEVYSVTGIRVISLRPDSTVLNIWFPIFLTAIAPTLYLLKLVTIKYYQICGEDYIRTAVAKGLDINYINLQHVYKNIEPFIIADLTKMISLAVGNLFIIEYLLNVPGITRFIFLSHQFQPIVIGLFSMLLISVIVYFFIRLVLFLIKRGLIYE